MFDNVAFNVFIGLVFVFLLYSLLATIIQEVIARWLTLRARMLQKGIRRMLQDQEVKHTFTVAKIPTELWESFLRFFAPYRGLQHSLFKTFYQYPTIKYLAESSWNNKPSYLDATVFSQTMVYLLQGSQGSGAAGAADHIKNALFNCKNVRGVDGTLVNIDKETCEHLGRLWNDAQGDIAQFRLNLEAWFNQTMDRVTGWYVKQTKIMLFIIGLFIAISCQVDCIRIYKVLSKDKSARDNLVQLAVSRGAQQGAPGKDTNDEAIKAATTAVRSDIDQANTILSLQPADGEGCRIYSLFQDQLVTLKAAEKKLRDAKDTTSSLFKNNQQAQAAFKTLMPVYQSACRQVKRDLLPPSFWGYMLTALAISLGSAFWFDLLNRLIQLRGTGTKPADPGAGGANPAIKPLG